jgi:hypothetical protein
MFEDPQVLKPIPTRKPRFPQAGLSLSDASNPLAEQRKVRPATRRRTGGLTPNGRRAGWQGFCDAEIKAAGLFQIKAFGVPAMKHQHHFGSASDVALREVARISALISDLDRVVGILDCDIATEEERGRMSDPFDATYPILARTLTARRDNLKDTIAALEKRLAGLLDPTEQVPA